MRDKTLVQNGGDGADWAEESARALRGKIARLPKHVREELNRRLDDGEPASSLSKWLNGLPAVKRVLARYFGGAAIIEKNISNWRANGYKRWVERQEFLAEIRELAEEAEDFSRAAGEKFARGTTSIAAAKILKMLHAIKPEDCEPGELAKVAFAITALAQVEHANERLKLEKTRVYQGNERLVLSWDKHLRDCVATAQRVMDDQIAKDIQNSDIDNSEKIELLGHYLFKDRWCARTGSTRGPITPPGAHACDVLAMTPSVLPNEDPMPANSNVAPKGEGKTVTASPSPVPEQRQEDVVGRRCVAATADQQVSPTTVQVGPAVVGEKSEVNSEAFGEAPNTAREARAVPEPSLRDIELLMRRGKTLEAARRELSAQANGG